MLGFIKKLFGSKPAEATAEVPYKVEQVPTVTEVVAEPVKAESVPAPVVKTAPAPKKKPAPKKAQAPKTVTKPVTKPAGAKKGPNKPKSKPAA